MKRLTHIYKSKRKNRKTNQLRYVYRMYMYVMQESFSIKILNIDKISSS